MSVAFLRNSVVLWSALAATLMAVPVAAQTTYFVTVDTSSVQSTSGFLDFQFNPGNATSQPATAVITNFTTAGGGFTGVPSIVGNVSGTLPGTLTFVNSTALNEYFQNFNYGTSFSFLITLSGPAISSPNGIATAGSTFGLGLYDALMNPILTNQGAFTGFAGQIDINLNGSTTATAFPSNAMGAPSVVSFFTPPQDSYQLDYLPALVGGGIANGYIDISNAGSLGADPFGPLAGSTGRICANIYVFTADEQESECCSCLVTPNALVHLTAADLIGNPGNGVTPTLGVVVKILATIPGTSASAPGTAAGPFTGSSCNPAFPFTPANFATGMVASATKFHTNSTTSPASVGITETKFSVEPLSSGELTKLTNLCQFIAGNQSGAGLCKVCSLGGLGAGKK